MIILVTRNKNLDTKRFNIEKEESQETQKGTPTYATTAPMPIDGHSNNDNEMHKHEMSLVRM